jgi:hypothetical protein
MFLTNRQTLDCDNFPKRLSFFPFRYCIITQRDLIVDVGDYFSLRFHKVKNTKTLVVPKKRDNFNELKTVSASTDSELSEIKICYTYKN